MVKFQDLNHFEVSNLLFESYLRLNLHVLCLNIVIWHENYIVWGLFFNLFRIWSSPYVAGSCIVPLHFTSSHTLTLNSSITPWFYLTLRLSAFIFARRSGGTNSSSPPLLSPSSYSLLSEDTLRQSPSSYRHLYSRIRRHGQGSISLILLAGIPGFHSVVSNP